MPVLLFGIHVPTVGALFWKADFLSRLDQLPEKPNLIFTGRHRQNVAYNRKMVTAISEKPQAILPIYDSTILNTERYVFSVFGKVVELFPHSVSSNFPASVIFVKCSEKPGLNSGMISIGTESPLAPVAFPMRPGD